MLTLYIITNNMENVVEAIYHTMKYNKLTCRAKPEKVNISKVPYSHLPLGQYVDKVYRMEW